MHIPSINSLGECISRNSKFSVYKRVESGVPGYGLRTVITSVKDGQPYKRIIKDAILPMRAKHADKICKNNSFQDAIAILYKWTGLKPKSNGYSKGQRLNIINYQTGEHTKIIKCTQSKTDPAKGEKGLYTFAIKSKDSNGNIKNEFGIVKDYISGEGWTEDAVYYNGHYVESCNLQNIRKICKRYF